ncbi:branched-chain amino acid ABC transporter permease [Bacillus sp. M6-12]|uniref:branched-chain amino acid ABC transporter permease n=1 Tax=Bacillus sp. M6-12 TaxID=2054166 RepID=UPI000C78E8AC|nr:branched-chain amino acid ABC transporter permease [Bacillus sp. M6-12]PLS14592.1 branched-chain amino acid ABC transporter permease [Bacillus sp. M6-12]
MYILQTVINGVLLGGVYALIAIGLTLILGTIRIINFAHGELLMISMYIAYILFSFGGLNPYASSLLVAAIMFIVGMAFQRFAIQPIQSSSANNKILMTLGISIILQNLALMVFSANYYSIQTPIQNLNFEFGGVVVSMTAFLAFLSSLLLSGLLFLFLRFTYTGKAIRALAQNHTASLLMGIKVKKMYMIAFGIGSALVGFAGAVLIPMYSVYPTTGTSFVLLSFVIVVLGGMGSILGAFIGGLVIGVLQSMVGFFEPALSEVAYFILFLLILLVKPSGLLGLGKNSEEVGLK